MNLLIPVLTALIALMPPLTTAQKKGQIEKKPTTLIAKPMTVGFGMSGTSGTKDKRVNYVYQFGLDVTEDSFWKSNNIYLVNVVAVDETSDNSRVRLNVVSIVNTIPDTRFESEALSRNVIIVNTSSNAFPTKVTKGKLLIVCQPVRRKPYDTDLLFAIPKADAVAGRYYEMLREISELRRSENFLSGIYSREPQTVLYCLQRLNTERNFAGTSESGMYLAAIRDREDVDVRLRVAASRYASMVQVKSDKLHRDWCRDVLAESGLHWNDLKYVAADLIERGPEQSRSVAELSTLLFATSSSENSKIAAYSSLSDALASTPSLSEPIAQQIIAVFIKMTGDSRIKIRRAGFDLLLSVANLIPDALDKSAFVQEHATILNQAVADETDKLFREQMAETIRALKYGID